MSVSRGGFYFTRQPHGLASVPVAFADAPVGAWMIAAVAWNGAATLNVPAGWTSVLARSTAGTLVLQVLARQKQLDDKSVYDFSLTAAGAHCQALGWIVGAKPVGDWIVGALCNRATPGASGTRNIATGVTTTTPENLILTISSERTTNIDTVKPVPRNAAEWFWTTETASGGIETIGFYTSKQRSAGLTPDVTVDYQHTQASNGMALQIAIPPADSGLIVGPALIEVMPHGQKVEHLIQSPTFRIAHRGGGASWPEMTMRAYTNAVRAGAPALEVSVQRSNDGVFVCHHDTSTLRMTGVNHTIATTSWGVLEPLMNTAANTTDITQPTQPMARLEEVLDAYASSHTLFVELKEPNTTAAVNELLDLLDSYNATDRIVWKGFPLRGDKATLAKARGYTTWGYYFGAEIDQHGTNGGPWDLIGLDLPATGAQWATAVATGKKVIAHSTINTDADIAAAVALGASGVMLSRW